ncbi:MAG TPA: FAD-binding oxidoreductase [Anaerolineae bacterium]|nr:FAD-binding oxidoreductase [Anaerolineae bacterium]
MYDYLIIGKGPLGSAAFRYLSQTGQPTAILGPDEPTNPQQYNGPFGAHYDAGRLAHHLVTTPLWTTLGTRAFHTYPQLEQASHIPFYTPSGGLHALHPRRDQAHLDALAHTSQQLNLPLTLLTPHQWATQFPYLNFPPDYKLLWDPPPAGYLNPRQLIRAQLHLGQAAGGTIIPTIATHLDPKPTHLTITTNNNQTYHARRVLLATGAFTNHFNLLPQPLPLRLKTEQFVLAELSPTDMNQLHQTPTVNYQIDSPYIKDIYLVPPLTYPDGRHYLKLGANTHTDQTLTTYQQLLDWYQHGDSHTLLPPFQDAVHELYPHLTIQSWRTGRCVITYTHHGQPYIDTLIPGQLYTAIGGNGRSAYPSDTLGHLAAQLVHHNHWTDPLPHHPFQLPPNL